MLDKTLGQPNEIYNSYGKGNSWRGKKTNYYFTNNFNNFFLIPRVFLIRRLLTLTIDNALIISRLYVPMHI